MIDVDRVKCEKMETKMTKNGNIENTDTKQNKIKKNFHQTITVMSDE